MLRNCTCIKGAVVVGLITALSPALASVWAQPLAQERTTPDGQTIAPGIRTDAPPTATAGGFLLNNGSIPNGSGRTVSGINIAGGWTVFQPFTVPAPGWNVTTIGVDGWNVQDPLGLGMLGTLMPDDGSGIPDEANPIANAVYHLANDAGNSNWQDEPFNIPLAPGDYWMRWTENGDDNHWSAIFLAPSGEDSFSRNTTSGDSFPAGPTALRIAGEEQGGLIWFDNQADFEAFNQGEGKVLKGIEDFEESILDPNNVDGFDDPLESGVANLPDGFPFPEGMTGLPNLIVQSNLGGGNSTVPNPAGVNGLAAASNGFLGAVSDVVLSNTFVNSLDLIFTEDKSGVGFNTLTFLGGAGVEISVYSTSNVLLGEATAPADTTGVNFIGVWSPEPIGRINIWDPSDGAEGADRIQAWEEGSPPCPWDLNGDGTVGAFDLVTLLNAWGPNPGHPADFNGDGVVGALDLVALLFNWGPCP